MRDSDVLGQGEPQAAPQLTAEGAEALARALEGHKRHDTARARAGAHRRARDPLLDAGPAVPAAPHTQPSELTPRRSPAASGNGARAGAIGLLLAIVVVGCSVWLLSGSDPDVPTASPTPETQPTADAAETVAEERGDRQAAEAAIADSAEPEVVVAGEVLEQDEASASSADTVNLPPAVPGPESIDLTLYDVLGSESSIRSFAIRVQNLDAPNVLDTESFDVALVDDGGQRFPALVRFEQAEIPTGSSAIATVRAEGVDGDLLRVILEYQGVSVADQPLESASDRTADS